MEETLHKTKVDIMTTLGERITTMNQRTANIEANMNTLKKQCVSVDFIDKAKYGFWPYVIENATLDTHT